MNIHHANLFLDAGGASKYCNDWLSRLIAEEKRDEQEARRLIGFFMAYWRANAS